jgi:hypothetical protein
MRSYLRKTLVLDITYLHSISKQVCLQIHAIFFETDSLWEKLVANKTKTNKQKREERMTMYLIQVIKLLTIG